MSTNKYIAGIFSLLGVLVLAGCGGGGGGGGETADEIVNSSPPDLILLNTYDTPGQARSVLVDGDFLYVADGASGLLVFRLPAVGEFLKLDTLPIPSAARAYDLARKGNTLYMAARAGGVIVYNISNPYSVTEITTLPTLEDASYLKVYGNLLFVSAKADLIVYDISTPTAPMQVGITTYTSPHQQLVIDGDYAYVAAYSSGLVIYDVSNPAAPTFVSKKSLGHKALAVSKRNDLVFVGGGDGNIEAVDVSKPESPRIVAANVLPDDEVDPFATSEEGSPLSFLNWKNFIFVADGDQGAVVVDSKFQVVSADDTDGTTMSMAIDGRRLFTADLTEGVRWIDIFETTDRDGDGVVDGADVFPLNSKEWADSDGDGTGDNADPDDDNDGVLDADDDFPYDPTEDTDSDGDGVGDNSDAFPGDPSESADTDSDGIGNNADPDDDNDGLADGVDALPLDPLNLRKITTNAFGNFYPKLDGNHLAWNGYRNNAVVTVYIEDLTSGARTDLGQGLSGFMGIPSLSNGEVAWRVWDKVDTFTINYWDGSTITEITSYPAGDYAMPYGYPPSYHSIEVQLENGTMAWAGWDGSDYEIYFYDGANIIQITDNDVDDFEAQLSNGQISWTQEEEPDGEWDVVYWDGANIVNVSDHPGFPDEDSHISNGIIAWSAYDSTQYKRDIYVWDGSTTTKINLPGNDYEPQVSDDGTYVTWHNVDSSGNYHIYVWDGYQAEKILDGVGYTVKSPFAHGDKIGFVSYRDGGADIYIATYRIDKDGDGVVNGADADPLDPNVW